MKNKNMPWALLLAAVMLCGAQAQTAVPAIASDLSQYNQPSLLTTQARALLEQDNFSALEALAIEARATKARFAGGEWKLFAFYQSVTWPAMGKAANDLDSFIFAPVR